MFCINCGTNLQDGVKFCINCGQPVQIRPVSQEAPKAAEVPAVAEEATVSLATAATAAAAPPPVPTWEPEPQPAPQPGTWEPQPAPQPAAWEPQPAPQPAAWEPQPQPQPASWEQSPQNIPPVGQGYVPERTTEAKKEKKKFPVWIPIVAGGVLLAGIALALLLIFGGKYKINMNDYVKLYFDGYDTLGQGEASFDAKAFRKEYSEKLKWRKKSYEEQYGSPVDFLIKVYTGSLSKTEKLTNGEKLKYKWKLSEEFPKNIMNADISAEDFEVEVKGLEEVEVFDPFEGMEVVFKGVDGYGYLDEIIDGPNVEKYALYVYPEDINVMYDHNLSNGDQVVLTIGDEDLIDTLVAGWGVLPSSLDKTITVQGLEEVEAFDPFEDLEVIFSGFNGSAYADYVNNSSLDACQALYFQTDTYGGLRNGDEVRFFIEFSDEDKEVWAERYGMIPAYTEKTYVVSGLDHYAESYEEMESIAGDMYDFVIENLEKEYSDRGQYGFSLDNYYYSGYYFMKDDPSDDVDNGNIFYLVFHETISTNKGETREFESVVMFYDVKIPGEGEPTFSSSGMTIRYYSENKVAIYSDKYTLTLSAFESLEETQRVIGEEETQNEGLIFESSDIY